MHLTPAQSQRYENSASEAEFQALIASSDAAEQPALHPDQFRFWMLVMLRQHPMPVPVVLTVGVDDHGLPLVDDAWIYLPGHQAVKKHRGEDFDRIRSDAYGEHWPQLVERARAHVSGRRLAAREPEPAAA